MTSGTATVTTIWNGVDLTRHRIANLSSRSDIRASWCGKWTSVTREAKRRWHDGTRQAVREEGASGLYERVICIGRTVAHASLSRLAGRIIRNWYLLYRNKEIRPSNKRVLRSQFNNGLPETFTRSVTRDE